MRWWEFESFQKHRNESSTGIRVCQLPQTGSWLPEVPRHRLANLRCVKLPSSRQDTQDVGPLLPRPDIRPPQSLCGDKSSSPSFSYVLLVHVRHTSLPAFIHGCAISHPLAGQNCHLSVSRPPPPDPPPSADLFPSFLTSFRAGSTTSPLHHFPCNPATRAVCSLNPPAPGRSSPFSSTVVFQQSAPGKL